MSIRLSAAIMTHPARDGYADRLLRHVPDATIVTDPEPHTKGCWACAREAWLAFDAEATHHLVLQDDAVPCPNFRPVLLAALSVRPDDPLSLYANDRRIEQARERGVSWVVAPKTAISGLAVVLPTGWIRPYIATGDHFARTTNSGSCDEPLRDYLAGIGARILWTVPSLVDHGEPERSLIPGHGKMPIPRVARWWAGDGTIDPVWIDWTKGP